MSAEIADGLFLEHAEVGVGVGQSVGTLVTWPVSVVSPPKWLVTLPGHRWPYRPPVTFLKWQVAVTGDPVRSPAKSHKKIYFFQKKKSRRWTMVRVLSTQDVSWSLMVDTEVFIVLVLKTLC